MQTAICPHDLDLIYGMWFHEEGGEKEWYWAWCRACRRDLVWRQVR